MSTRNATYWICQILGWGIWSAIGISIAVNQVGMRASIIIGYALFFGYSIALTHWYRREIRRRQWLSLPARRMVPRLLGASLLTAAVQSALVIGIAAVLEGTPRLAQLGAVL